MPLIQPPCPNSRAFGFRHILVIRRSVFSASLQKLKSWILQPTKRLDDIQDIIMLISIALHILCFYFSVQQIEGQPRPASTIGRALASQSSQQSEVDSAYVKKGFLRQWKNLHDSSSKSYATKLQITDNAIYWTRTSLTLYHCVKGTHSPNKLALYEACTQTDGRIDTLLRNSKAQFCNLSHHQVSHLTYGRVTAMD